MTTMNAALTPIDSRVNTSDGSFPSLCECGNQGRGYGYSALHEAIISRDFEYLDFLLKSVRNLEHRDENGFTALHVATLEKTVEAVDLLVNAGSNIGSLTKEGMTPLHIGVEIQDNEEILAILATSNSAINIRNKVGRTALHLAARSGNLEYLKILLDAGCDREITDKFGMKAVDAARARNHERCVQVLLFYTPQKRSLKTLEDNQNQLNFRRTLSPYSSLQHQVNCDANLNALSSNAIFILKTGDRESKKEQKEETTRNDNSKLVVPKISICELDHEKVMELGKSQRTQTGIIATFEEQVMIREEIRGNENEKGDVELENNFNKMDSSQEKKTQMNKNVKIGNEQLDISGRIGLEYVTMGILSKDIRDNASSEEFDISKLDLNGIFQSMSLSSAILDEGIAGKGGQFIADKCGQTEESHASCKVDNPSEKSSKLLLQNNNASNFLEENHSALYKSTSKSTSYEALQLTSNGIRTYECINSGGLLKVVTTTLNHDQEEQLEKISRFLELCCCKKESIVLTLIPSASLLKIVKLRDEDVTNGWLSNAFCTKTQGLCTRLIISKVLQYLKRSIYQNTIITYIRTDNFPLQSYKQAVYQSLYENSKKQRIQKEVEQENLLKLFVKTFRTIKNRPTVLRGILDEFYNVVCLRSQKQLKTSSENSFSCCNPSSWEVVSHEDHFKPQYISHSFSSCLEALDYIKESDNYLAYFVWTALEYIPSGSIYINSALKSQSDFLEFAVTIATSSNEAIWDEEKIANIFLFFCRILEDDLASLCRIVDVLLRAAFSRNDISILDLSSCILLRMGLLKSEFKINIVTNLKGPLLALKHAFTRDYLPRFLASVFVSFLSKPSARFAQFKDLHTQALKSALLKTILPQPSDQDPMVLGKGLKRICDVLGYGNDWETACYCCEVLFEKAFESTRHREVELGESIIVYFGLIKSEERHETIKDILDGLKLLQHLANGNQIPKSIALMVTVFLNKESKRLEQYKEEVECLVKRLERNFSLNSPNN